jgi:hypothetical protein
MMLQGALYILAGASLYAGARRLRAEFQLRRTVTGMLYTGLLLLLAASSALCATSLSPAAPAVIATLGLSSATLLWILLPWLTPGLVGVRTGLTTDLLTAAWLTALLGQLSYPQSISSYWSGVSWLALLTLFHSAMITLWNLWPAGKSTMRRYLLGLCFPAVAMLAGLAFDTLLFPFGFLLFLLVTINLSFAPTTAAMKTPALQHIPARPLGLVLEPATEDKQATVAEQPHQDSVHRQPAPATTPRSSMDQQEFDIKTKPIVNEAERDTLITLADDLMDITVYSSMALNRMQKDKANSAILQSLLRRIRSRAINGHREANRLSRPSED